MWLSKNWTEQYHMWLEVGESGSRTHYDPFSGARTPQCTECADSSAPNLPPPWSLPGLPTYRSVSVFSLLDQDFFFSLFQVTWTSYWLLQYYTFILFHITSSYFIFTSLQLDSKFHRWRHYLVWVVHCIPIIYLSHIYCVFNYEPDTMYYLFQVFEYYQATTTIILNLQGGKDSKLRKVT